MLGIELRASHMLAKHTAIELYSQARFKNFLKHLLYAAQFIGLISTHHRNFIKLGTSALFYERGIGYPGTCSGSYTKQLMHLNPHRLTSTNAVPHSQQLGYISVHISAWDSART